jgi:hypothetical protein
LTVITIKGLGDTAFLTGFFEGVDPGRQGLIGIELTVTEETGIIVDEGDQIGGALAVFAVGAFDGNGGSIHDIGLPETAGMGRGETPPFLRRWG